MKIKIQKNELLNIIGRTQNIVEKRNTMPVLVNVLLEAEKNKLTVFATDLEVSLTDSVICEIQEEGKVAVSAKSLFDITKELADGFIQLIKKENNWLEIKQGKYVSKIVGISADDYPVFPSVNSQTFIKVKAQTLKEMIDKTIYSVSTDETRYHLNGVYFELSKNVLKMVATDGHRLSLIEKKVPSTQAQFEQGVIIPRKGLVEIRKIIETMKDEEIEVSIEGSQFILKKDTTTLLIRLIEGKYPDYQKFIPQKLSQKMVVNKEMFLSSLKRVSLLANQKSKAILLNFMNDKLEISSNNPELGDAKEELEINFKGKDAKIGYNAKYIQDVLTNISEENIDFEFNDQLSPGLIRPHDDSTYTCVVMPMRI